MAGGIFFNLISKFDDKGVKQAQGAFGVLGTSLSKIAGLVGAAFSAKAIGNFAEESIRAAEGVQIANNRIDQIAKSMGIFGDETKAVADRLKEYADANEFSLGVDAEVIKATQAKLLTFKQLAGTADEVGGSFDRATKAAFDLAAAGFGSAESNATQLGKALQDPIKGLTALRRAGVTFTEAEKEKIKALVESGQILEAQNVVLSAIEQQVGGTAAATATASARMKIAFENIKESVGGALMPTFAALTDALLPVIQDLAPLLGKAVEGATPAFTKLAEALPTLVSAFIPLLPLLIDILSVMAELAAEIIPIFVDILGALIPVVQDLLPIFLELFQDIITPLIPAVLDLIEALVPIIKTVFPVLVDLLSLLLPPLITLLEELFIPLIPVILDVIEAFMPLLQAVLPVLAEILETVVLPTLFFLADLLKVGLIFAIGVFQGGIQGLANFITGFAAIFKAVWEGIADIVKGVVNTILGFIQSMVNGVISGINAVIRAINSFKVSIPSLVPGQKPIQFGLSLPYVKSVSIPKLADGGIVMPQPGGVLANLAEAGQPEAVIPLSRFDNIGQENTYNITVNAGIGSDPLAIGRSVVDAIKRYERINGPVFVSAS
jgi:phage-related protein